MFCHFGEWSNTNIRSTRWSLAQRLICQPLGVLEVVSELLRPRAEFNRALRFSICPVLTIEPMNRCAAHKQQQAAMTDRTPLPQQYRGSVSVRAGQRICIRVVAEEA